jgi:hypothetical protein
VVQSLSAFIATESVHWMDITNSEEGLWFGLRCSTPLVLFTFIIIFGVAFDKEQLTPINNKIVILLLFWEYKTEVVCKVYVFSLHMWNGEIKGFNAAIKAMISRKSFHLVFWVSNPVHGVNKTVDMVFISTFSYIMAVKQDEIIQMFIFFYQQPICPTYSNWC